MGSHDAHVPGSWAPSPRLRRRSRVDLPGNEKVVVSRPRSRSGSTPGPDGLPTSRTHNTRTQRHTRPALARLIGQLGDPSAQISGAPADRAVVGMPADAAAVAHREGVLPGGKKRPQFLSKLVHVLHGCLRSWSRASRRRRLAPRIERRRRLLRYIRPDKVGCTCGRPPRRRAAPPAVVVPLDNIGAGARASIEPDVTMVVLSQHAAAPFDHGATTRSPCLLHGLSPASPQGPRELRHGATARTLSRRRRLDRHACSSSRLSHKPCVRPGR
jgi:hypothetical protein